MRFRQWMTIMAATADRDETAGEAANAGGGGGALASGMNLNVIEAFSGLSYPLTSQDVLQYAQDEGIDQVMVGRKQVSVREVLRHYPEATFLSRQEIENAFVSAQTVGYKESETET